MADDLRSADLCLKQTFLIFPTSHTYKYRIKTFVKTYLNSRACPWTLSFNFKDLLVFTLPSNQQTTTATAVINNTRSVVINEGLPLFNRFLPQPNLSTAPLQKSYDALLKSINGEFKDKEGGDKVIKFSQVVPSLRKLLLRGLHPSIVLSSNDTEATHFLSIFHLSNNHDLYIYALTPASSRLIPPSTSISSRLPQGLNEVICRSYFKLQETFIAHEGLRKLLDANNKANNIKYRALDIGSCPGGWSQFLRHTVGVGFVIAVDPGEMSADLKCRSSLDRDVYSYDEIKGEVWHVMGKLQDNFDTIMDILNKQTSSPLIALKTTPAPAFDFIVCDANIHPLVALEMLTELTSKKFFAVNSYFIFTLKLTNGRHGNDEDDGEFGGFVKKVENLGFTEVEVKWMFGNGRGEREVVGRYIP